MDHFLLFIYLFIFYTLNHLEKNILSLFSVIQLFYTYRKKIHEKNIYYDFYVMMRIIYVCE